MTKRGNWTCRRMLGASAGVIAAAASGASLRSALAAPAIRKGSKLTYWGGLIFSDDANKLLTDTINKWGKDNGVDDRSRDDQPERDHPEGLGGGRLGLHAGCARRRARPAAAAVAAGPVRAPSTTSTQSIGKPRAAGSSPSTWRPTSAKVRRRAHRHSVRRARAICFSGAPTCSSRPASPTAPTTWQELLEPGREGQQAAALRAWPGALQCRRRQYADVGDAVLRRAHRRRRRQEGGHQVRRHARTYLAVGEGRLGQGAVPAGQHDLGRRRRQPGLSQRARRCSSPIPARWASPPRRRIRTCSTATLYSSLPGGPKGVISPIQPEPARHSQVEPESGHGQGAARIPGHAGLHEGLFQRTRSTGRS